MSTLLSQVESESGKKRGREWNKKKKNRKESCGRCACGRYDTRQRAGETGDDRALMVVGDGGGEHTSKEKLV